MARPKSKNKSGLLIFLLISGLTAFYLLLPGGPRFSDYDFLWVALGDSLTIGAKDESGGQGYFTILTGKIESSKPRALGLNLAENGWTCRQIVEQPRRRRKKTMLAEAVDLKPRLVILWIGVNDVTDWTWDDHRGAGNFEVAQFQKDYRVLLTQLRKESNADIIVGTLFDLDRTPVSRRWHKDKQAKMAQRIKEANKVIMEEAQAAEAGVADFFGYEELYRPENWSADGLHPNHRGYQLIAERWGEVLETVLKR